MTEGGTPGAPTLFLSNQRTSVSFDGGTERLRASSGGKMIATSGASFTLAMWVKLGTTGPFVDGMFQLKSIAPTSGVLGLTRATYSNKLSTIVFAVGDGVLTTKSSASTGITSSPTVWRHLVFTFDPAASDTSGLGAILTYLNAVDTNSFPQAIIDFGPTTSKADFRVNVGGTSTQYLLGDYYDFAIFDTVATQAQVTAMYNSGLPIDYTKNSSDIGYDMASNLTHWFKTGHQVTNIGGDFSSDPLGVGWDLMEAATNIDTSDIKDSWPGE
jgi:hypothetical protein